MLFICSVASLPVIPDMKGYLLALGIDTHQSSGIDYLHLRSDKYVGGTVIVLVLGKVYMVVFSHFQFPVIFLTKNHH